MKQLLLHALKLHLTVMQKPTEALCSFSLKFIDILTDTDDNRIKEESRRLLIMVSKNIVDSIIETIDKIEETEVSKTSVLSPAIVNIRTSLKNSKSEFLSINSDTDYTTKYSMLVAEIGKSMKVFGFCGLVKDMAIINVNGEKLC